jgi:hypothetical protein
MSNPRFIASVYCFLNVLVGFTVYFAVIVLNLQIGKQGVRDVQGAEHISRILGRAQYGGEMTAEYLRVKAAASKQTPRSGIE